MQQHPVILKKKPNGNTFIDRIHHQGKSKSTVNKKKNIFFSFVSCIIDEHNVELNEYVGDGLGIL